MADFFHELNTDLSGKQDKLTNPLVQNDIINNLSSTATNKPLSAAQGRELASGAARDNTKLPLTGGNVIGSVNVNGNIIADSWLMGLNCRGAKNTFAVMGDTKNPMALIWTGSQLDLYIDAQYIGRFNIS